MGGVRCYGARVDMLGALCCPEILMAGDSHCGLVLFRIDNVLQGGRLFEKGVFQRDFVRSSKIELNN